MLAEWDEEVVTVSRQYLGAVHRDAFADPRLELRIGDGFAHVREATERYDLVLLDLTDPDTPAAKLYTADFFAACRRLLNPGGAMVLHIGSPVFTPERVRETVAALGRAFATVRCYGLYIPLYGAYWGMAVASEGLDPPALGREEAAARIEARGLDGLRYYNGDVHGALFALPNYYRELV